jgi:spore maturation protein CgeB
MPKILFIANLHHPDQLRQERHSAQLSGNSIPLFPSSSALHFWEKAFLKRGYTLDLFWRNLSGFGSQDIASLRAEKYTNRITAQRIAQAIMHRLPYEVNLELKKRNANLLEKARQFQPDIIWLVGDNTVVHADTLAQIKAEINCKILYLCGTSPIIFSHKIERDAARVIDLVVANDYYHGIQWREMGAKAMVCLPASSMDADFHYPRELSAEEKQEYSVDVSFVGTLVPDNLYRERVEALEALRDFNLGIWSVHDVPESLRPYYRGRALGETMMKVLSAGKITINTHGDFMRYGGNMRLFEAAGAEAFQIVDNRVGIHEWFTDTEHLITYHDMNDLREKVVYYLEHPEERQRIAKAARQHALEHHSYDKRLIRLLEIVETL